MIYTSLNTVAPLFPVQFGLEGAGVVLGVVRGLGMQWLTGVHGACTSVSRSQAPKFGNWESEEDVPYTVYFDNANRKGKVGPKMNPNDPQDYSDAELKGQKGPETTKPKHSRLSSREDGDPRRPMDSPLHSDAMSQKSAHESPHHRLGGPRYGSSKSEVEGPKGPDMIRLKHDRQVSREDGEMRRPTESPSRSEISSRRSAHDSPLHRHGGLSAGDTPKRISRQSVGSDRSIDNSPLHPHSQAKAAVKGSGVSSPSWDRKSSVEGGQGMAPLTPGRSRLRSVTRGDDTPDHSPAVPKFGDWDETDPSSAEGYTHIFNKVREEKQSGAGKVPVMPTEGSYANGQKRNGNGNAKVKRSPLHALAPA
ncbi:OLC1v1019087C1 [Oldenlandia corymbosa var. corymbosa]|uniref:OLC1v1019087C1 n=1 Tax=Oldenlandia corymbosa var. corymbosa TaxID=529605 RepID=A0AAV1ED82_OLDCO|nr:OLC1v1019087C1 [Oldenlandia corymbosa var. corymbosa]